MTTPRKSHRREFFKQSAASLAGLGLAAAVNPSAAAEADPKTAKRVELAIATICCDGFGDENFEPAFRLIPRIGFKNVEFNCWHARNLTPAGLRSIQERCQQHGLRPVCVQGSSFGAAGNIVKDVAHKLWCMEAARQLGCRRVKFTGSKRGAEGGLDAVIRILKELAPAAEAMDQLILVENHANNNLENIEDFERVFEAIDSPNVGLCLDTGHFDGANVDMDAIIERFHARTLHIDLKDCAQRGVYKTVRFGEGVTDFHGVIQKMLARGYAGYLLVEQAPPIHPGTLEEDLAKAYRLFQRYET